MTAPAPLAFVAAKTMASLMADTQDRAMVEQLIDTRKEGRPMPSLAILPPLAQVAARILDGDGTDDAAQYWLRQGEALLEYRTRQAQAACDETIRAGRYRARQDELALAQWDTDGGAS